MSLPKNTGGRLIGVGVGPGDPELITLKAVKAIAAAPVVAYAAAQGVPSFARQIAAQHISAEHVEYVMSMPMTVQRFPAREVYDTATSALGAHLDAGRDVAVLCEGDPLFYGSFMYLFGRMSGQYSTTVIPGISSLTACAAAAGFPLCARNDVLSVLPGPLALDADAFAARLSAGEAFVIPKVGRHLSRIGRALFCAGLLDQAVYVERASLDNQRVMPLAKALAEHGQADDAAAPYFSMILVHRRGTAY